MKIKKLLNNAKKILKKKTQSLKKKTIRESKELEELENKLKELENKEKNTQDNLVRDNKLIFKFWIIALLVVFIGYLGFKSLDFIYLILSAFIISIAVEAVIDFFQKKFPRRLSILSTYLLIIIFIFSCALFIIPFIIDQMAIFMEVLTRGIINIQNTLDANGIIGTIENIGWLPIYLKNIILKSLNNPNLLNNIQNNLQNNISQIIGTSTIYAKTLGNIATSFIGGFFSTIGKIILVMTLSVLFSIEKKSMIKFIGDLGGKKKEYLQIKLKRLYKKLGLWLKGQLFLCLFIAVAIFIALIIMSIFGLEIPEKGSLAIISGITEIIPYLGPLLGGIPAVIIVFLHNGFYASIIMIGVIILIQWLENNVLIPVIMNKTLGINPITIFISMIFGGLIMGFVGILLAVPIAVILTIFLGKDFKTEKLKE